MARTSREFEESPEMRELAEELWDIYSGNPDDVDTILGSETLVDIEDVWFAWVVSPKAKNSKALSVKSAQDWQKEGALTSYQYAVLIYRDDWDDWDTAQKERKIFSALAMLSSRRPDVEDYTWLQAAIGPTYDVKGGLKPVDGDRPSMRDAATVSKVKTAYVLATKDLEDDDEPMSLDEC